MPVPAGIRQAVRRQVARLGNAGTGDDSPAPGTVLATAAALGPGIDPALVAAALGVPAGPVARLWTALPRSACSAPARTLARCTGSGTR